MYTVSIVILGLCVFCELVHDIYLCENDRQYRQSFEYLKKILLLSFY